MKITLCISLLLLLYSCNGKKNRLQESDVQLRQEQVTVAAFQNIIDTANVEGAILIYDLSTDTFYSNDFEWIKKGRLPASTFKIANSIIALESGIVENDSTLFKWDGTNRSMDIWEQDLLFKEAFHLSCVPCYQEIARKIGVEKMSHYLDQLAYGSMTF